MRETYRSTDFRLLERLVLISQARLVSLVPGARLGATRGSSTEFADYRPYYPGDDVRCIDWTIYARLGKRFIRLFQAEAQLDVHILLDTSNSMRFGEPTKLAYAKQIVAALGYVGLRNLDRVGLATFAESVHHVLPPRRGSQQLARLFDRLDAVEPAGVSDFNRAFREYAGRVTATGLLIIVSDFLGAPSYETGLRYLLYKKFRVTIIHVLDDEELEPQAEENIMLRDLEHDTRLPITIDADVLSRYRVHMHDFISSLQTWCRRHGLTYVQTRTSLPFAELIRHLQQAGVWQPH